MVFKRPNTEREDQRLEISSIYILTSLGDEARLFNVDLLIYLIKLQPASEYNLVAFDIT